MHSLSSREDDMIHLGLSEEGAAIGEGLPIPHIAPGTTGQRVTEL
ncbi:MAG: hypothetical protein AAF745_07055 [Planctomycetota bacterium]